MSRIRPPDRARDYHEPIWACRSFAQWNKPPVISPECDPGVAKKLLDEYEDGERNPTWTVWAGGLFDPATALAPANDEGVPVPGAGVVCTITRCKGELESVPPPEQWAKRFVHCVNAFRGIATPSTWIADAVLLLGEIARDEDFNYGRRAGALLAQIKKPVPCPEAT